MSLTEQERIDAAAQAVRDVYKFSCVGSACHIVTDDLNVGTHHIDRCLEHLDANLGMHGHTLPEQREACLRCLTLLRALSIVHRLRALARAGGGDKKDEEDFVRSQITFLLEESR